MGIERRLEVKIWRATESMFTSMIWQNEFNISTIASDVFEITLFPIQQYIENSFIAAMGGMQSIAEKNLLRQLTN